jgi:hypothetical protein
MTSFYHKFIDKTIKLFSSEIGKTTIATDFNEKNHAYTFQKATSFSLPMDNSQDTIQKAMKPILLLQDDLQNHFISEEKSHAIQFFFNFYSNHQALYKKWIKQTLKLQPDTEEFIHLYRTLWHNHECNFFIDLIEPENKSFILAILASNHNPELKFNRELCLNLFALKKYHFTAEELRTPLLNYLECHKDYILNHTKAGMIPPNTTQKELFAFIQNTFPESQWQYFSPYLKNVMIQPEKLLNESDNAFIENESKLALISLNVQWLSQTYPHLMSSEHFNQATLLIEHVFSEQKNELGISSFKLIENNLQNSIFLVQSNDTINKHQLSQYIIKTLALYDSTQNKSNLQQLFSKALFSFRLENSITNQNDIFDDASSISSKLKI